MFDLGFHNCSNGIRIEHELRHQANPILTGIPCGANETLRRAVSTIKSPMLQRCSRQPGGVNLNCARINLAAYRFMLKARVLDDKYAALYRAPEKSTAAFSSAAAQEALSVRRPFPQKNDVFAPLIRDAGRRLAFGKTILDAIRTYLGSPLGPMRGRDATCIAASRRKVTCRWVSHLGE